MKLNNTEINIEIDKINKIIEEYNSNVDNLKNEYQNLMWDTPEKGTFDNKINDDFKKIEYLKLNIQTVIELYEDISNKYSNIGNKIKCNFDYENKINEMFIANEELLDNIINLYNQIDVDFDEKISTIINKQLIEINNQKNILESTKNNIKSIFKRLKELDQTIKKKVDEIELLNIKQGEV